MRFYLFTFFIISISISAQESSTGTDSLENAYIQNYHNQLNTKLNVSKDYYNYQVPFVGEKINLIPNIGTRFSIDFSYKFVSLSFGFRAPKSKENKEDKGDSDVFTFKFGLIFDRWAHQFNYARVKGFYIKNTDEVSFLDSELGRYIQFPELISNTISGSSSIRLNKNYSVKATHAQTEIQLKSAGTFMPILDYNYYSLAGFQKLLPSEGDPILRAEYSDLEGFITVVNMGYYYTFVHKKWYANAFVKPGVGINFYKIKNYSDLSKSTDTGNDLVVSFQAGAGFGYSGEKYYFGVNAQNVSSWEKYDISNIQFQNSTNSFNVFLGYRFKAPKSIAKPIDDLEKRVPILK